MVLVACHNIPRSSGLVTTRQQTRHNTHRQQEVALHKLSSSCSTRHLEIVAGRIRREFSLIFAKLHKSSLWSSAFYLHARHSTCSTKRISTLRKIHIWRNVYLFCDDICGKEMYIVQSADLQHFSCNNLLITLGFVTIFVRRGARSGVRINLHTTCETRSGKPEPSVMILRPDLQFVMIL